MCACIAPQTGRWYLPHEFSVSTVFNSGVGYVAALCKQNLEAHVSEY